MGDGEACSAEFPCASFPDPVPLGVLPTSYSLVLRLQPASR